MRKLIWASMFWGFLTASRAEVLDTLAEFGNAATANTISGAGIQRGFTNPAAGEYTITAGGHDFWNTSDHGSFLYDADTVQSGDFSAVVRSDSVSLPGEPLALEWGRSGLMARSAISGSSAHVSHMRKSGGTRAGSILFGRDVPGGTTDRGPTMSEGEFDNRLANTANGSVANTPIWMGLHRFAGEWYATWAADDSGAPGTWSRAVTRPGSAETSGDVYVGLGHHSHNIHPQINTASFSGFSVGGFDNDLGEFPLAASGSLSVSQNGVRVSASATELGGGGVPVDVEWDVRFVGGNTPTSGLQADIYLGPNLPGGNLARINNSQPAGSVLIPNVSWGATNNLGYPDPDPAPNNLSGPNLFAEAVPGHFGGNEDNYGVHLTGEVFIPSDTARAGLESIRFHDGVDDYAYLEIDGTTLIDDNAWTNWEGIANGGGSQGTLDVSESRFDDGEWVEFRMLTWEGGGGDMANLVWDALDRTGFDEVTGGADGSLGSYNPSNLPDGGMVNFLNDLSDQIPTENFRTLGPELLGEISGLGSPDLELIAGSVPDGTLLVELLVNGDLVDVVPIPEPATAAVALFGAAGLLLRRRRS